MAVHRFNEEHHVELKRIFTELAYFMHRQGIKRIVACGSSASPYVKALSIASLRRFLRGVSAELRGDRYFYSKKITFRKLKALVYI